MGVTKYILKHPVTTVMALLCLVVFGISSVFSAKLEQMPDMETPMLIIMANYSGAGPEDISELVTEPIEEAIGTMEGVDTISSTSSDGRSMIMLQYDYGTDMDEAYDNLKQKLDNIQRGCRNLYRLCEENGLESSSLTWDMNEKGIWKEKRKGVDDYLYALKKKEESEKQRKAGTGLL